VSTWGIAPSTQLTDYSRRATLPATGQYRVRVRSATDEESVRAPYLLELYTVSSLPEQAASVIQFGDTITERIDRPGDLDVFTFAGVAGRDANIFLGWPITNGELGGILVLDPVLGGPRAIPFSSSLDQRDVGRFTMEDRTYTWIVDPLGTQTTWSSGEYRFRAILIDTSPETQPSAYVIGDTLSAEALSPAGDIDDFTFTVATETSMKAFFEGEPMRVSSEIINSAGTSVWQSLSIISSQPFTLPAGQYRLRVLGHNDVIYREPFFDHPPAVPYRFALTPQ
ncbi:MAG TPA: hypothetical protein VEB19_02605, partial [Gemmatimonadaceae bacterium]|nr:hypothetical protein [Gemmatimonadaceae bacterium]